MDADTEPKDVRTFAVRIDDAGRRLDRVLRKLLPRASLARIYTALRHGEVRVDGGRQEPHYRVLPGQTLSVTGSLLGATGAAPAASRPVPWLRPGEIVLYRNEHFVVFNKPRGIPVHGAESLASAAADLLSGLTRPSLSFRPGPVHRLDKDTSGLVFFAVSLQGARLLSALLRDRACEKTYLALLEGTLEGAEQWRDTLARDRRQRLTVAGDDGDLAVAEATPLAVAGGLTLARVRLESGRTHQIRAQAALHGRPLLGDGRYGGRPEPGGYVLHAARFRLPAGTPLGERTLFVAPLPASSRAVLEKHFGAAATAHAAAAVLDERPLPEES